MPLMLLIELRDNEDIIKHSVDIKSPCTQINCVGGSSLVPSYVTDCVQKFCLEFSKGRTVQKKHPIQDNVLANDLPAFFKKKITVAHDSSSRVQLRESSDCMKGRLCNFTSTVREQNQSSY